MSIFRKDKPEDKKTDIAPSPEDAAASGSDGEGEMEEIYSTKTKKIKYKRETPIESEAAAKRQAVTKEELINGKLEFSTDARPKVPEVELKSEHDPDAVVSDEIIEDVEDVRSLRGIYVQDVNEIDINLDPMDSLREYERASNDRQRSESRRNPDSSADSEPNPYVHKGEKIVSFVPVYRHEDKSEKLFLKAGRFTQVVESEYDEYLKSTDPAVSGNYHAMQKDAEQHPSLLFALSQMAQKRREEAQRQKPQESVRDVMRENFDEEQEKPRKKQSNLRRFFRILFSLIADIFVAPAGDNAGSSADYDSREDENYVLGIIRGNIKKRAIHTAVFSVIFAGGIALSILERTGVFGASDAVLYCGLNLILMLALCIAGRGYIVEGLRPLAHFRGNCDSAAALASLGCLAQAAASMFFTEAFVGGSHHLYGYIAAMAMALNAAGRLLMAIRVKSSFKFITSQSPAYAAKIYTDEETARRMVSGTTASKGVVAYQHLTRFLSDFLKISYAPDPSEEMSGKLTPVTAVAALFVTVMYAVLFKSVPGTFSAMAVMLCVGVPFTALLAGNIPMLIFSKKMLSQGAMVAGYPSVRQFCDTSAVMMNACELFPKGSVRLKNLISFQQFRVEENLLMAAAVLKEAMSPIAPVFDELIAEHDHVLPNVESVIVEDKSGLVGWIGGERVLIGNMTLMNRYHITIPDQKHEKIAASRGYEVTYIACSGQAVAMLALSYRAPKLAREQMQAAERSGLAFIISSPDPNVTAEMVAGEYGLFYRSVGIMPPGYSLEIDEVTSKVEETSRAYLATRGRQTALARAVGGCANIKSNIALSIAIGVFGLLLGVLLCATLVLYATVARLSIVEMMIYILFWTLASLFAALIRRA